MLDLSEILRGINYFVPFDQQLTTTFCEILQLFLNLVTFFKNAVLDIFDVVIVLFGLYLIGFAAKHLILF